MLKPTDTNRPSVGSHDVGQSGEHRSPRIGGPEAIARAGYRTVDQCPLGSRQEIPITPPAPGFGDYDFGFDDSY